VNNSLIIYTSRPDATPEGEAQALVEAYRFILRVHEEKKNAEAGAFGDAEKASGDALRDSTASRG